MPHGDPGRAGGGLTVSADLRNGVYQFWTYDNRSIREVSLKSLDIGAKDIRYFPIDQPAKLTDISK